MNTNRIISKIKAGIDLFLGGSRFSYAQFGEDLVLEALFTQFLNNPTPSYLDIGANNPKAGSNTYLFYLKKCYGVCVEPDVVLHKKFKAARPNDIVLNAGVGVGEDKQAVFYCFPEPYTGWNTFSKEDALKKQAQTGVAFNQDQIVPFVNINDLMAKHFTTCPDFVSIDVEGLDLPILESLDFNRFTPPVFCIETMEFNNMQLGKKNQSILSFMEQKGYVIYADTYINSIFVKKELLNL